MASACGNCASRVPRTTSATRNADRCQPDEQRRAHSLFLSIETLVHELRDDHDRHEPEPHDPTNGRETGDAGQEQCEAFDRREDPPVTCDEPEHHGNDDEEDQGSPECRRPPFVDVLRHQGIPEQLPGSTRRDGTRRETRTGSRTAAGIPDRGEQAPPGRAVTDARHTLQHPDRGDEHCAERDGPVHVRPENERGERRPEPESRV